MKRQAIAAAVLAGSTAFLIAPSAVRADDAGTAVLKKINAAQKAQTSWVITTTAPSSGLTSIATYVRTAPKTPGDASSGFGAKTETAAGPATIDTYIVNSTLYMSINGGAWQKKPLNTDQFKAFTSSLLDQEKADPEVATLQPDRVDGGVTYGDIRVITPTPPALASMGTMPKSLSMECMYDKTTYLMHECETTQFSMSYSKYGDPANTVVLPAAAANATLLNIPLPGDVPAAAASAAPAH
jgi:hypothetical protein